MDAIESAKTLAPYPVETIVVLNRCTDNTEQIALNYGAKTITEDTPNLSIIRNAGLDAAEGDILVTVDADSRLHPMSFVDIVKKLESRIYIGGGCLVLPERYSLGIISSIILLFPYLLKYGVSFGAFWFTRKGYQAVGGFNSEYITIEDVDFGVRLKRYGKSCGKKFGTLFRSRLITSCRKFDQFGDWHMIKERGFIKKVFEGTDQKTADRYWYETGR